MGRDTPPDAQRRLGPVLFGESGMMPGSNRDLLGGIPDMRYINRDVRVADVARKLDLRLDGSSKIHCWRPDRHQNGDRTASVGIRAANNTVKCFGCHIGPLGPIDLVMDVLGMSSPADAALWIAGRFAVPSIPSSSTRSDASQILSRKLRARSGPAGSFRVVGNLVRGRALHRSRTLRDG
jgi:hypothetical protein